MYNPKSASEKAIRFYDELDPYQFRSDLYNEFGTGSFESDCVPYAEQFSDPVFRASEITNMNCIWEVDHELLDDDPEIMKLFIDYYESLTDMEFDLVYD